MKYLVRNINLLLVIGGLFFFSSCDQVVKSTVEGVEDELSDVMIDELEEEEEDTVELTEVQRIVGAYGMFRGLNLGDSYVQVINTEKASQNEIGQGYVNYLIEDSLKEFTEIQYNFSDSSLASIDVVMYCTNEDQREERFESLTDHYLEVVGGYSSKSGVRTWKTEEVIIDIRRIGNEKHPDIKMNFSKPE